MLCRGVSPMQGCYSAWISPKPAAGSRKGNLWAHTSTELLILLFPIKPFLKKYPYIGHKGWEMAPTVCLKKCSYPGKQIKTKPDMDGFYSKGFQPPPYPGLCVRALVPYNEKLLEMCKTTEHPHTQSFRKVNSVTCPSPGSPCLCVPLLSAHPFPILFSRRWPRLKVYWGWLFRKIPLSKSASN